MFGSDGADWVFELNRTNWATGLLVCFGYMTLALTILISLQEKVSFTLAFFAVTMGTCQIAYWSLFLNINMLMRVKGMWNGWFTMGYAFIFALSGSFIFGDVS